MKSCQWFYSRVSLDGTNPTLLNGTGSADVAVGAPFDGDGKVFIYRGSDAGIETKPAQASHSPVSGSSGAARSH